MVSPPPPPLFYLIAFSAILAADFVAMLAIGLNRYLAKQIAKPAKAKADGGPKTTTTAVQFNTTPVIDPALNVSQAAYNKIQDFFQQQQQQQQHGTMPWPGYRNPPNRGRRRTSPIPSREISPRANRSTTTTTKRRGRPGRRNTGMESSPTESRKKISANRPTTAEQPQQQPAPSQPPDIFNSSTTFTTEFRTKVIEFYLTYGYEASKKEDFVAYYLRGEIRKIHYPDPPPGISQPPKDLPLQPPTEENHDLRQAVLNFQLTYGREGSLRQDFNAFCERAKKGTNSFIPSVEVIRGSTTT